MGEHGAHPSAPNTRSERRADALPRARGERRREARAAAPLAPAAPPTDGAPVDDLRREIRELMRAIERLERGGGR